MMDAFLPYHCPTFRTDHLNEPCQTNLARVKALKEAKKHVGPIEKCVECKGKMLITKPLPNKSLKAGRLSTEQEAMVIHPIILLQLSPEKIAAGRAAVQRLEEKEQKKEEPVPFFTSGIEIMSKSNKKASDIVQVKPEVLEGKVAPFSPLPRDYGARYCPTHPEVPQRIDKLGRWTGMCAECLAIRGKKCGEQNFERGVTAPPVLIPLNLLKYAEVKEWLAAQAEENERTLGQQIMMILKTAWRQGI